MDDFTSENFTANLKLATSFYPSISDLCRKLEINRQQFMKYLSGGSFPSRYNLRRICDFFGFDEFEMLMPHDQFRNIVRLRPVQNESDVVVPPLLSDLLSRSQRHRSILTKTHGYYHQYYLSFSNPKHVLKSLVYVYGWNEYTLYKRIERLRHVGETGRLDVYKYAGIITIVGDRIHMLDHETITGSELTQTVLYLNYKNRISVLSGLIMGVSGSDAHQPSCSRVVLEYIGRSVNLRQAIHDCRVYPNHDPHVPSRIQRHLSENGKVDKPLLGATL